MFLITNRFLLDVLQTGEGAISKFIFASYIITYIYKAFSALGPGTLTKPAQLTSRSPQGDQVHQSRSMELDEDIGSTRSFNQFESKKEDITEDLLRR